jgi:hypothetical protein
MNTEKGPLTRLLEGLGIDADLAPIAAVKRIDEMPRRLNIPEHYTDGEINALVEDGKLPEPTSVAELFFHTNKRRNMVFDEIPVGHDTGYRCYDGDKHDPESAYTSGEYGEGLTEDEAYVDWLQNCDREEAPRRSRAIGLGRSDQPPDYVDDPYRDPDED